MDGRGRDESRISKRLYRTIQLCFSSGLPLRFPSSGVLAKLLLKEGFEDPNSLLGDGRDSSQRAEDLDGVHDETKRFLSMGDFAGGVRELEDLEIDKA